VHRSYFFWLALGLALPALIGLAVGGADGALAGFLWGGLVRIFANHHVTWSINSVCHMIGRRPHPAGDGSRNVWLLAVPTVGGSWHNNHHAFPASAVNDLTWWQFDPGAWLIRLGALSGLVWDVRQPPDRAYHQRRRRGARRPSQMGMP
jgi:stearoyl-CoA desaturase (delta-9 desaturase)